MTFTSPRFSMYQTALSSLAAAFLALSVACPSFAADEKQEPPKKKADDKVVMDAPTKKATGKALAELWGMTGDEEIKPILKKAVELIVGAQSKEGGWRYEPVQSGADISVTIMQVMALRAAKNSGLHVPDETMKKAIKYIETCEDKESGGYTYQPGNRQPGFARTAAGACVLQLTGQYEAKQIPKAIEYMKLHSDDRT